MGLSLGAIIGRSIIQDCETKFPVRNFVSLAGPHMGIEMEKDCKMDVNSASTGEPVNLRCSVTTLFGSFLDQEAIGMLLYNKIVQRLNPIFQLFRDSQDHQAYLENNLFLPALNNEKPHDKSSKYKNRIEALNFMTLIMFSSDPIIYPIDSCQFGEMTPSGKNVRMEDT